MPNWKMSNEHCGVGGGEGGGGGDAEAGGGMPLVRSWRLLRYAGK